MKFPKAPSNRYRCPTSGCPIDQVVGAVRLHAAVTLEDRADDLAAGLLLEELIPAPVEG